MKVEGLLEKTIQLPEKVKLKVGDEEFSELVVRECYGQDEEFISSGSIKNNPIKIIPALVYRCISEVPGARRFPTEMEFKRLPIGVVDSLLLEIRELSVGKDIKFTGENMDKKPVEVVGTIDEMKPSEGSYDKKEVSFDNPVGVDIVERGADGKEVKRRILVTKFYLNPLNIIGQELVFSGKDMSEFGKLKSESIHASLDKAVREDGTLISLDKNSVAALPTRVREKLIEEIQKFPTITVTKTTEDGVRVRANILDFLL